MERKLGELDDGIFIKEIMEDIVANRVNLAEGWPKRIINNRSDAEIAAGCYCIWGQSRPVRPPTEWPWSQDSWMPNEKVLNIKKAVAILLTELERLKMLEAGYQNEEKETESTDPIFKNVATVDKLKPGMMIFDVRFGWQKVHRINHMPGYPIHTHEQQTYRADGKREEVDKYPSIYLIDIFNGGTPPDLDIQWWKVPHLTSVFVKNKKDAEWIKGQLVEYRPKSLNYNTRFRAIFSAGHEKTEWFECCKLHPEVEIKAEWLK